MPQHSQDYASWYAHVPGLKVVQPYSAADAKGLLKAAIRDPNPVIFLENEILYGHSFEVPDMDDFVLPIGKAKVERGGTDVTLVSWGIGMTYTIKAAEELAGMGISAEVINLRTIRPLDIDTVLASVRKTGRIVTIEEAFPMCSSFIGNRLPGSGKGVRLSRRTDPARDRQGRSHALRCKPGKAGSAERW